MEWLFFIFLFFFFLKLGQKKDKKESKTKYKDTDAINNTVPVPDKKPTPIRPVIKPPEPVEPFDIYKLKGDNYEKHIGGKFEEKNYLVIYNGLIKGMCDNGVDLIVIHSKKKAVNLVQCKNWNRKLFSANDIETVYDKLNTFKLKDLNISVDEVMGYLQINKNKDDASRKITDIKEKFYQYEIKKTLYISNDINIDLEVGKYLKMIRENVFNYKDMKMVISKFNG